MSSQQYKPRWRIIAREGDFCSIRGQSSGSVWHNVSINELERVNGKEEDKEQAKESQEEKKQPQEKVVPATSRLLRCDESNDCDDDEKERQLELFPV